MTKRMYVVIFTALLFLVYAQNASAQQETGKEIKGRSASTRGITGEVSAVSKDFIAVVYKRTQTGEEEMAFPVSPAVRIENKKSLSQISVGDVVDIEFEEIRENNKSGVMGQRAAKVIRFLKASEKQPTGSALDSADVKEAGEEEVVE